MLVVGVCSGDGGGHEGYGVCAGLGLWVMMGMGASVVLNSGVGATGFPSVGGGAWRKACGWLLTDSS